MPELTFRDIRTADHDDMLALASDWSVVRQLDGWPWPPDPALVRDRCKPYANPNGFAEAICIDDRLVGTIGIIDADIGYALHPDHQRQGIGTMAVRWALNKVFDEDRQGDVITAETWHDNPASHRLLLRHGFHHWKTHYVRSNARGAPTLSRSYRLSRGQWLRLKPRLQ